MKTSAYLMEYKSMNFQFGTANAVVWKCLKNLRKYAFS